MNTEDISINYLSTLLCTAADLPLSGYQSFLQSIQKQYPVITGRAIIDSTDGTVYAIKDLPALKRGKNNPLSLYQAYAYNHIFDTKHRLNGFFD